MMAAVWQHWAVTAEKRWEHMVVLIRGLAGYIAITGLYNYLSKNREIRGKRIKNREWGWDLSETAG